MRISCARVCCDSWTRLNDGARAQKFFLKKINNNNNNDALTCARVYYAWACTITYSPACLHHRLGVIFFSLSSRAQELSPGFASPRRPAPTFRGASSAAAGGAARSVRKSQSHVKHRTETCAGERQTGRQREKEWNGKRLVKWRKT